MYYLGLDLDRRVIGGLPVPVRVIGISAFPLERRVGVASTGKGTPLFFSSGGRRIRFQP